MHGSPADACKDRFFHAPMHAWRSEKDHDGEGEHVRAGASFSSDPVHIHGRRSMEIDAWWRLIEELARDREELGSLCMHVPCFSSVVLLTDLYIYTSIELSASSISSSPGGNQERWCGSSGRRRSEEEGPSPLTFMHRPGRERRWTVECRGSCRTEGPGRDGNHHISTRGSTKQQMRGMGVMDRSRTVVDRRHSRSHHIQPCVSSAMEALCCFPATSVGTLLCQS